MGKVRRSRVSRPPKKSLDEEFGSDDERRYGGEEQPQPESSEYLYDEVEEFDRKRTKSLVSARPTLLSDGDEDAEEEIMPLESDDDDDDGDDMDSDLDTRTKDDDEDVPDEQAWGARKRVYYDTEYPDDDRRVRPKTDEECAEDEEEGEALAVQRRLAQAISDDDLGLDLLQAPPSSRAGDEACLPVTSSRKGSAGGARVTPSLDSVPRRDRILLMKGDSPELPQLLRQLKHTLEHLELHLLPLEEEARRGGGAAGGLVAPGDATTYIHTKYRLCWNYCVNLCFYLMLKARRTPVSTHPVISRLLTYRGLLDRLSPLDERLRAELTSGPTSDATSERAVASRRRRPLPKDKDVEEVEEEEVEEEQVEEEEVDAETARRFYDSVVQKLQQKRTDRKRKLVEEDVGVADGDVDEGAKRAITHQIARNKGLTARRKKIDRNPRVKHREKFRRAGIRRKGQVRVVRHEVNRYGGELSGIRAGVKKGIKLK